MKILLTGATGFIGSRLLEELLLSGNEVTILTRNKQKAESSLSLPIKIIEHDLTKSELHFSGIEQIDYVINLMGENIANGRWTESEKKKIFDSRVQTGKNLVNSINKYMSNCKHFVSASATGIYPESKTDNDLLEESTLPASTFLSEVVQSWESVWNELNSNIQKLILRFGIVLGHEGGMLAKILPIYRKGIGGKLSSGQQWMSWIHLNDIIGFIQYGLSKNIDGTFNLVSSDPVKNEEFNDKLAKYCQRPGFARVPKAALKLVMGEASLLALESQKVSNLKLKDTGYKIKFDDIDSALKDICCFEALPPLKDKNFHQYFRQVQYIDKPINEVYEYFSHPKNLDHLTPEFLKFRTVFQSDEVIKEGTVIIHKLSILGIPMKWKTIIHEWNPGKKFVDYEESGPYQVWYHEHTFSPMGRGTFIEDKVRYRLPMGALGEIFGKWKVDNDVKKIFSYRKSEIEKIFST